MIDMIETAPDLPALIPVDFKSRKIDFDLDSPMAQPCEAPITPALNPKPRLQIPGDDRLTSIFAAELAEHLKSSGLFALNGKPVIKNCARAALEPISAMRFVTWIEHWVR